MADFQFFPCRLGGVDGHTHLARGLVVLAVQHKGDIIGIEYDKIFKLQRPDFRRCQRPDEDLHPFGQHTGDGDNAVFIGDGLLDEHKFLWLFRLFCLLLFFHRDGRQRRDGPLGFRADDEALHLVEGPGVDDLLALVGKDGHAQRCGPAVPGGQRELAVLRGLAVREQLDADALGQLNGFPGRLDFDLVGLLDSVDVDTTGGVVLGRDLQLRRGSLGQDPVQLHRQRGLDRLSGVDGPKQRVEIAALEGIEYRRIILGNGLFEFHGMSLVVFVDQDEDQALVLLGEPLALDGEDHAVLRDGHGDGLFVDETHAPEAAELMLDLHLRGLEEELGLSRGQLPQGQRGFLGGDLAGEVQRQLVALADEPGPAVHRLDRGDLFRLGLAADGAAVLLLTGREESGLFLDGPLAPGVLQRRDSLDGGFAAAFAAMLALALLGAARFLIDGPLAPLMAEGGDRFDCLFTAACAEALLLAGLGAARLDRDSPIAPVVAEGGDGLGDLLAAACADMLARAGLGAVRLCRDSPFAPVVAECGDGLDGLFAALAADALARAGLGAARLDRDGPLAPAVLMGLLDPFGDGAGRDQTDHHDQRHQQRDHPFNALLHTRSSWIGD